MTVSHTTPEPITHLAARMRAMTTAELYELAGRLARAPDPAHDDALWIVTIVELARRLSGGSERRAAA